jgi:hypothetical protein
LTTLLQIKGNSFLNEVDDMQQSSVHNLNDASITTYFAKVVQFTSLVELMMIWSHSVTILTVLSVKKLDLQNCSVWISH